MKMKLHVYAWILILTAAPLAGAQSTTSSKPAKETKKLSYANPAYSWSISYPIDWMIDKTDQGNVRVFHKKDALCGVYSASVAFKALDEFTDYMEDGHAQRLLDKGLLSVLLSRQNISLPNEVVGNDVLSDLVPGGRSRRVYILTNGRGFAIDCEAAAKDWGKVESSYDLIIKSFALGK